MSQPQTIEFASPEQAGAWSYGPYPMLMSGGFGSGKSWLGCMKALWLSDTFPGNRGAIIRQVAKHLRKTTMATFRKICPKSAYQYGGWNTHDGLLTLNNGSEILWLQLDDPSSLQIIKGLEINWFFIDQAEENPDGMEEIYDTLLSRLGRWDKVEVPDWLLYQEVKAGREWKWRHPISGKPVPPQYAMLACNPDSELHWLYRRFHPQSLEHRSKYAPKGYKMFHMPSTDNKFLTEQNKANLLDQDESFVRRYVRGEWGFPEGAIHEVPAASKIEFHDPVEAQRFLDRIRTNCALYRVMDHGESSPTCVAWVAVDKEGNVFFYREYYQPNKLISYHREVIAELSTLENYQKDLADPSIFNLTAQKITGGKPMRYSVADEYKDTEGYKAPPIYWQAADNNELATRNRINEYLRIDPDRPHPITKLPGSPKLFFVMRTDTYPQGCFFVPKETIAQRRVQIGTIDGRPVFSDERATNVPDHGYDPVRYCIAHLTRFKPSIVQQHKQGRGLTFEQAGKLYDKHQRILGVRR